MRGPSAGLASDASGTGTAEIAGAAPPEWEATATADPVDAGCVGGSASGSALPRSLHADRQRASSQKDFGLGDGRRTGGT